MSVEKMDKSSVSTFGVVENHAAKRQKLEGGLLRKVVDAEQLKQNIFVHKVPKRDGITNHTKTRITIPREPDLETAQRALKTRPKTIKEAENVASTVRRFKAHPLNRKILEAPSLLPKRSIPILPNFQEFHLKTSERAMLHKSVVPKFAVPGHQPDKASHKYSTNITPDRGNREPERPIHVNASRPEILTSKGTFGVFRNSKKDTTVPMEFNFHTEKRFNHNPPIELFNKGSKENRLGCFQKDNEIKQSSKLRPPVLVGMQQIGVEAAKIEVYAASCFNWSNSVR